MKRVQDKVVLVTGGASGLGEAMVRCLVAEGARVIIADIQVTEGTRLADEFECEFLELDVTSERHWKSVITQIENQYQRLDILVNNAGIEGPIDKTTGSPETTSLSDWEAVQRVNVGGVFLGCKTAIPALRRSGGGTIVNLSSIAALVPTPEHTAYGASKAAVRHLTKSVAHHCASDGSKIRCNSVHPGLILTPMLQRIFGEKTKDRGVTEAEIANEFLKTIPQAELQTTEDVAHAVLFLVSDETSHIAGIKLVVDGGFSMEG